MVNSEIIEYISKLDFPAVLWELRELNNIKNFFMLAYSNSANNLDIRNYELFLDQPYRLGFSEALDLQNSFFSALERNEVIEFAEYEHAAFRPKPRIFKIWIIPFPPQHVIVTYEEITETKSQEKSDTFLDELIQSIENLR